MIQTQTHLKVIDNSGARQVQCIKVLGGSRRKVASVGDIIMVAVKESVSRGPMRKGESQKLSVKKGEVHRALIVRCKKEISRQDGSGLRFDENAVVLVNAQGVPLGTRILGPVSRELRNLGFMKVISLAPKVI